jgi:nicotinate-nucleotide pyrophosphorylase (carboxylating)
MKDIDIKKLVRLAVREDVAAGDITTDLLVVPASKSRAGVYLREDAVICGLSLARAVFSYFDPRMRYDMACKDGQRLKKGDLLFTASGRSRAILTGERVALNFLGYLSAIATKTDLFVRAVRPYQVLILDTRKTTPGLRSIERYAVRCGGGHNHRFDLASMVLIKDNHRFMMRKKGRLSDMVLSLRSRTRKKIQVEVDHISELIEVLPAFPDMVLLDNMSPARLKQAVAVTRKMCPKRRPLLEASGGITLSNVRQVAMTGVDRISVGALTHSRKAIDMTLEFES